MKNPFIRIKEFLQPHVQYIQLCALLLHFTVLYFFMAGDRQLKDFAVVMTLALVFELGIVYLFQKKLVVPVTGAIAMMGMFLHVQTRYVIWPYIVGILLASLSKQIFRFNGKAVFNPSNFAIIVIILTMSDVAYVNLSQWFGFAPLFAYFLIIGTFVSYVAGKIYLSYSYLIAIILLRYSMSFYTDLPLAYLVGTAIGFNNYVFAFHMITDPRTSPNSAKGQILFGLFIAVLDFSFRYFQIIFAPFLALFIACIMSAIYSNLDLKSYLKFGRSPQLN